MSEMPTIYTAIIQRPAAVEAVEAMAVLAAKIDEICAIESPGEEAKAAEFRARLNQVLKNMDEQRKTMTAGARQTVDMVNGAFKPYIEKGREGLGRVDAALKRYRKKLREQEEEERRQAEQEAEEAGLPPSPQPPAPLQSRRVQGTHGSSVGTRENWRWRITDVSKIPEEYLKPPEERVQRAVVNAYVRANKDKGSIPGIEIYRDDVLTSTVGV